MSHAEHEFPADRRIAVRWASSQQASCHYATFDKIATRWATVLNVSRKGMAMQLSIALEVDQQMVVELPCKDLLEAKIVSAQVVRVDEVEAGTWEVACAFDQPLSDEDLESLV